MATIHVDVVSAEESIFSGEAKFVALPGESGELGILPRHTPLITRIKPGAVRIERADNGEEEFVFVAGGILEVQPNCVTVLSDTAIRGKDLDEAEQNAGCYKHLHMPQLIANFAALKHAGDEIVIYTNVLAPEREIHQPIHTSHDITNCNDKTTLGWDYSEHERAAITFEQFLEAKTAEL